MSNNFVQLGSLAEFINGAAFKPEDWGESGLKL
jgi:type I restriction enzyme, S subunit